MIHLKKIFCLTFIIYIGSFSAVAFENKRLQEYESEQKKAFEQLFIDPQRAIEITDSLLQFNNIPDTIYAYNWNLKAIYYSLTNNNDSALYYIDKAIEKAIPETEKKLGLLLNKCVILKKNEEIEKALNLLYQVELEANKNGFSEVLGRTYGELASNFFNNGLVEEAITYIIISIELFEKNASSNENNIFIEKQKLANYYLSLNNYKKANIIYTEILPYFKTNQLFDKYYLSLIGYTECLINSNKIDSALHYAVELNEGIKMFNNDEWLALAQEKLAKVYFKKGNYDEAHKHFKSAIEFAYHSNSKYLLSIYSNFLNILNNHQLFNKTKLLINDYDNRIQIMNYDESDRKNYYKALTDYYKSNKDWEKVLIYRDSVDILKNQIESKYNLFNIMRIEAEYKTKILEQNNQLLNEKLTQEKKKFLYITFLSILLLLLFLISFRNYKLGKKILKGNLEKTIQTNKALEKQIEIEKELSSLKEKTIENQKNEILQKAIEKTELNKKIDDLIANIDSNNKSKISQKLENLKSPENNVFSIVERYKNLNPNFEDSLKKLSNNISKSEIDLAILILVGLSFKEIASLFQISTESVYKKKYRLAKKLNISNEIQIIDFLKTL